MTGNAPSPLREALVVFVAVTAASSLVNFSHAVPLIDRHLHLAVALLFLFTAIALAQRDPAGVHRYGLDLGGLLAPPSPACPPGIAGAARDLLATVVRALPTGFRECLAALGVAAVVFPPFAVGFYIWHSPDHPFVFRPPPEPLSYLAAQLLLVGLPEEALFRGYFQTRLSDGFGGRVRLLGVSLSPIALALQAALFAVVHFAAEPNPARLAVFFPALLFGWMRQWRGGIGVAVLFHALCNLFSDTLVRGWL